MSVGELVFEVSDRASVLIREEVELAKTEVTEKFNNSLLRGSVAGLAAGVFVLLALILLMHGVAWLLNDLVFNDFWAGFFVEAGLFLLIGAAAGLFAWRSIKRERRRPRIWRWRKPRRSGQPSTEETDRRRTMINRVALSRTLATTAGRTVSTRGDGRWTPPPGSRSAEQIRQDIVQQRQELSRSVDALRSRWLQVTDVKRQISEHRTELAVGAAVVGFLVGGVIALRRRR